MNDRLIEKSTLIHNDSKLSQWCIVNTDNEFSFMGKLLKINDSVEDYKVYKKAGTIHDFKNEAYMDKVLVVVNKDNNIKFYDQNYNSLDDNLIGVVE